MKRDKNPALSRHAFSEKSKTRVPDSEIHFSFSRASGPGGQNVNKVNTKVTLRWDYHNSKILSSKQKGILTNSDEFRGRINNEGDIVVTCSRARSQGQNRVAAVEKLHALLDSALEPIIERVPTKISRSSKERRLKEKIRQSERKSGRRALKNVLE